MSNEVSCPKCSSTSLSANKKGFSGKKAVAGAILTGGIGLLAGTIGSNKVKITCLNCGHEFSPGDRRQISQARVMQYNKPSIGQQKTNRVAYRVLSIVFGLVAIPMIIAFFADSGILIFIFAAVISFITYGFWSMSKLPIDGEKTE